MTELLIEIRELKTMVSSLLDQPPRKDWYSTDEVAEMLGRAPYTVREWCRHKRLNAQKRPCGRGTSLEWMISFDEIQRYRNEGLLK